MDNQTIFFHLGILNIYFLFILTIIYISITYIAITQNKKTGKQLSTLLFLIIPLTLFIFVGCWYWTIKLFLLTKF